MEVTSLTLQQFRSYNKQIFQFSPTITLIVGPNTAGKTNILEGIYCLATGKSFRAEKESDMVRWGEEVGRIHARIITRTGDNEQGTKHGTGDNEQGTKHGTGDNEQGTEIKDLELDETILELVITTGEVNGEKAPSKKYIVNGVPRRQIDFVGNVRAVLFSPGDLEIVTDSPSLRRQYLNSVLVQTDREYRRNLLSYERGIRQRNKLLDLINEGKAGRSQLLFWNQLCIKSGSYITDKRHLYIEYVNNTVLNDFHYRLEYDKSIISESRLDQYKDEEVAARSTLVGPQRDDIVFEKSDTSQAHCHMSHEFEWRDISRFGSRGEQRLAILWLKLAELSYIEKETEERPILLLDDIFSELDEKSRTIVLSIIDKQQTLITSAEDDVVQLFKKSKDVKIVRLPVNNPTNPTNTTNPTNK